MALSPLWCTLHGVCCAASGPVCLRRIVGALGWARPIKHCWEDQPASASGEGDGLAYTDGPQLLGRPVQCEPTKRDGCNASAALSAHRLDTPLPHPHRDWANTATSAPGLQRLRCSVYAELTLRCGHTGRTWLGRVGATNGSHKAGQPHVATIAMQQTHCNVVQQPIATHGSRAGARR